MSNAPLNFPKLQKVRDGELIAATDWNKMVDAVNGMAKSFAAMRQQQEITRLVFGELENSRGLYRDTDNANTAAELKHDGGVANGSDPWDDATINHAYVVDPQGAPQLAGERHVFMHLRHANAFIPLPGVRWALATLNGELTRSTTTTASIYSVSGSEADSGLDVAVYGWFINTDEELAAGSRVPVIQHLQSRRWYALPLDPDVITTPSASGCIKAIGGTLLADIPGYVASEDQALIHNDEGCLEWLTIEPCTTGSA